MFRRHESAASAGGQRRRSSGWRKPRLRELVAERRAAIDDLSGLDETVSCGNAMYGKDRRVLPRRADRIDQRRRELKSSRVCTEQNLSRGMVFQP
jgi:hypothetical protein